MGRYRPRRQSRYDALRVGGFTPWESRELSILPSSNPVLQALVTDRRLRRIRFERIASRKLASGAWKRSQLGAKWVKNLAQHYTRRRWRVQHGPVGVQEPMSKKAPNPWAMYRDFERRLGGPDAKAYLSPWQKKRYKKGASRLERGTIFIQQVERRLEKESRTGVSGTPDAQPASADRMRQWVVEMDDAIQHSSGARQRQLIAQRNRLGRLISR